MPELPHTLVTWGWPVHVLQVFVEVVEMSGSILRGVQVSYSSLEAHLKWHHNSEGICNLHLLTMYRWCYYTMPLMQHCNHYWVACRGSLLTAHKCCSHGVCRWSLSACRMPSQTPLCIISKFRAVNLGTRNTYHLNNTKGILALLVCLSGLKFLKYVWCVWSLWNSSLSLGPMSEDYLLDNKRM